MGFEPATFRTEDTEHTTTQPPRPLSSFLFPVSCSPHPSSSLIFRISILSLYFFSLSLNSIFFPSSLIASFPLVFSFLSFFFLRFPHHVLFLCFLLPFFPLAFLHSNLSCLVPPSFCASPPSFLPPFHFFPLRFTRCLSPVEIPVTRSIIFCEAFLTGICAVFVTCYIHNSLDKGLQKLIYHKHSHKCTVYL